MSFYQNLFDNEFRGSMPLDDRQYAPTYVIKPNVNRPDYMLAWSVEPYNLSSDTNLTINYAYDMNLTNYSSISINVAGSTPGATLASEVAAALNANATFSDLFLAQLYTPKGTPAMAQTFQVFITSKKNKASLRAYISNSGAEKHLHFNAKAPVAELPTYFDKYTLTNRFTCVVPSEAKLIKLNTADATDQAIITAAGFDYTSPKADWQLLAGRSPTFMFVKNTVDGSNRITASISYPAGASVGDFAKKTTMTYTGTNTNPDKVTTFPYILQSGDMITP